MREGRGGGMSGLVRGGRGVARSFGPLFQMKRNTSVHAVVVVAAAAVVLVVVVVVVVVIVVQRILLGL